MHIDKETNRLNNTKLSQGKAIRIIMSILSKNAIYGNKQIVSSTVRRIISRYGQQRFDEGYDKGKNEVDK